MQVWRRGLDLDGSRTVLRARRSEFRFPTEAPGHPRMCLDSDGRKWVAAMMVPQEIEDEEFEQVLERVAAIDVAKATGMVCTRVPHPSRPGKRRTRVWEAAATTGAVLALAEQLAGEGIEKVTLEATSDYWRIWTRGCGLT
jgi:hypothetical protein